MATITLYKDKINGVGSLLDDIIKSSNNLNAQLGTLKNTLQGVDSSTCNLQDTVDSISSSSKSEKDKVEDLKRLNSRLTEFIEMTTKRDTSAKSEIERAKEDFYTKYSYLKPECEKTALDYIKEGIQAVCEWCKEHWVEICIGLACIVIGAVLTALTGGAFLAALAAGLKTAIIAGLLSGGFNVAFYVGATLLNGGNLNFADTMSAFGDGLASGFMMGGIMAGASMAVSSGFRFAASRGVPSGPAKNFKLGRKTYPDSLARNGNVKPDAGGTIRNFASSKNAPGFRFDVDIRTLSGNFLPNYFHLHLPFVGNSSIPMLGILSRHIPVGFYGSVVSGTVFSNSDFYSDFKKWQRESWRKVFGN